MIPVMTGDIRDHRHTERRHMIRVKSALAAGLDAEPADSDFVLACADYLGYIVGRFTAQGRANVERLRPRVVAAGDDAGARIVADIARTLDGTESALAALLAGAEACRDQPEDGLPQLVAAARRFVTFYDAVLASRKDPAQDIIDRHFSSAEYWALTNDVTGESVATEAALFQRVARLAPPGVRLGD
jgi:hypothetical protein